MVNLNNLYNVCKTLEDLYSFFNEGMLMFDFFEEKNSKLKKEKNISGDQEEKSQFHDRYIDTQIQVDDFIKGREQNKKSTSSKNSSKKTSESIHSAKRKIKLPNFRMGTATISSESTCVEDELFEITLNNSSNSKSNEEKHGNNFQFEKIKDKDNLNDYNKHSNNSDKSTWSFKKLFGKRPKSTEKCLKDIKKVDKKEKILEKDNDKHQKFRFKIHTDNPKIAETITLQQKTDNLDINEDKKSTIAEKPKKWRKSKGEKLQEKQKAKNLEVEQKKKQEFKDESKPKKHGFFKRKNKEDIYSETKSKDQDNNISQLISKDGDISKETPVLDDEIRRLLNITDDLLGKLPDEVINEFAQSEDFKLYEKVMSKYKIK